MENLALTKATSVSFWRDKRVLLTGHTGLKGSWLALDVAKAEQALDVAPAITLTEAVEQTMGWYRAHKGGVDARQLSLAKISDFKKRALSQSSAPKIRRHAV